LTPWSTAAWIAATLASSSCPPHIQPPIAHVPIPMVEISNPDVPSARLCMPEL
jgi:hypothetical protein